MSDRGVSEGVEAVQVLVKNESVDVKVGENAHKGVVVVGGCILRPKTIGLPRCLWWLMVRVVRVGKVSWVEVAAGMLDPALAEVFPSGSSLKKSRTSDCSS